MKTFNILVSLFAALAIANPISSPVENVEVIQDAATLADIAMSGHTLCACQVRSNDQLLESATIGMCKDLGGLVETFIRAVDGTNGIKFRGRYCKPNNTRKLDGNAVFNACRNHNAGDSACPR